MYQVTSGTNKHSIQEADLENMDLQTVGPGRYHLLRNNKSYTIEVLEQDETGKNMRLRINGHEISTSLEDRFDVLLDQLGMGNMGMQDNLDIKAPMPGLVLDILVQENVEVKKGDPILILEAMKMENILKSPLDGVVQTVQVNQGDSVEKNKILVTFDQA